VLAPETDEGQQPTVNWCQNKRLF